MKEKRLIALGSKRETRKRRERARERERVCERVCVTFSEKLDRGFRV